VGVGTGCVSSAPPPDAGHVSQSQVRSRPLSLTWRLLLAATAVLAAFLGLTGAALDQAFQNSVLELSRERLEARIYLLLGAAEVDPEGSLTMPQALPESRLSAPGSGAYAAVRTADGELLWQSESSLGIEIPYPQAARPGQPAFAEESASDDVAVLTLSYPVAWELRNGEERVLVFQAAESREGIDAQIGAFRRALWGWLVGAAVLLLLAQGAVLLWGLSPLRRVAREIEEIESGERKALVGRYPRELEGLTVNLNALIRSGRARLQRYRDSLADLAHSLKTPLAVLRSTTDKLPDEARENIRELVERMDQTIEYQLQRAAASGRSALATPVEVGSVAERIKRTLDKVYADKGLGITLDVEEGVVFVGDPGDLTELLGNLLDNACKWAAQTVRLRARNVSGTSGARDQLLVEVEDDGPGIAEAQRAKVLERGVRADSLVPGQGIGLAIVREMVEEVYGGSIEIGDSELGGALVRLTI
jgi:two-component system sensor histidine kinase PhoQ